MKTPRESGRPWLLYGLNELSRVQSKRNKPIIGLAGGIGAGKSAVAVILESLGAAIVDSDRHAREEFRDPVVIATVRSWWGERVCPDGATLDRQAIAAIVFDDPAELARLEELLYPRLATRREELCKGYLADPGVCAIVLDSPKLYEVGLDELCDAVIFVGADRSIRMKRLAASRGWTEEELIKRENLLKPLDSKQEIADYTVVNHSQLVELRSEVERILASVLTAFS